MTTVLTPEQIQSRERFSVTVRQFVDDEAARADSDPEFQRELCDSIRGYVLNINYRYLISTDPIVLSEWDMHDLWFQLIQAAKVIDADDAMQDRLVGLVLWTREFGTLKRTTTAVEGGEDAVCENRAKIWSDLPYFVSDMREVWLTKATDMTSKHRKNLAAFTARCLALGVCGAQLGSCALWLLREALEVPRPLIGADGGDDAAVTEFLPACIAWFESASPKMLALSVENHEFVDTGGKALAPGELAREVGVERAGFTADKWLFWRKRFKDIARCEDAEMARQGRRGFNHMINVGREMGYEIPGEAKYWDRVQNALVDELKRSGKNCVSDQDIDIDLDWTE